MADLAENIRQIKKNIELAQARSPFTAKEVTLLAVTKTQDMEHIREAYACGLCQFGENRVQELLTKYESLPQAQWHLIGHLQTNKVKYIIDKVKLIHSLDSLELAAEINKRAAAAKIVMPVLVQVNIAEEKTKFGIQKEEVETFLAALADYPNLKVKGLMTIGPYVEDAQEIRPVFRTLRLLSQKESIRKFAHVDMEVLSMGMSNDYEVAVEEGATVIRLGTTIFGAR